MNDFTFTFTADDGRCHRVNVEFDTRLPQWKFVGVSPTFERTVRMRAEESGLVSMMPRKRTVITIDTSALDNTILTRSDASGVRDAANALRAMRRSGDAFAAQLMAVVSALR